MKLRTESIGVLNPVLAFRRIVREGTAGDVLECEVRPVHNVERPELGLVDIEVVDRGVCNVPEDEWLMSQRRLANTAYNSAPRARG